MRIRSLEAVTAEQVSAASAFPRFDGNTFVIEPETHGTTVNVDAIKECIKNAVQTLTPDANLKQENCYAIPKYIAKSEQVLSACETLNTYCQACVTYSMDVPVVVDKALISSWLSVDPEMNVSLDETAIREWMREFGKKYDTLGTSRMITTPAGKNAVVSGGTYEWSINEEEETAALLALIKNGEVVTKEPAYCQTVAIHGTQDWGSTYIEVDLSSQYMWYIENDTAAMECAVVTGKPDETTITPTGVYYISEKLSPSVLIWKIGEVQGSLGKFRQTESQNTKQTFDIGCA